MDTAAGDTFTIKVRRWPDGDHAWELLVNGLAADARDQDWVKSGVERSYYSSLMAAHAALGVVLRKVGLGVRNRPDGIRDTGSEG